MLTGWLTMFFYNKKHILKLVCTSNIYIDKLKPQAISLMNISSGLFFPSISPKRRCPYTGERHKYIADSKQKHLELSLHGLVAKKKTVSGLFFYSSLDFFFFALTVFTVTCWADSSKSTSTTSPSVSLLLMISSAKGSSRYF
jgi:hypothetical protein